MKNVRICVIGSANIDLTFRAPRFPQGGETLTGHSLHQAMGGEGAFILDKAKTLHIPVVDFDEQMPANQ